MNNRELLDFLNNLDQNNSVDWMHAHKAEYNAAKADFSTLLQAVMLGMSAFAPSVLDLRPRDLTFRINRDTRFSKDKRPYKTWFSAHISPAGTKPIPIGPYLHIGPGVSFVGAGLHSMGQKEAVTMARDYLVANPGGFLAVIEDPVFQANFTLTGEKLKHVPRGYDKDHPLAEYLKFKSWDVEDSFPDDVLLAEDGGVAYIVERIRLLMPINDYFNAALTGFQYPSNTR